MKKDFLPISKVQMIEEIPNKKPPINPKIRKIPRDKNPKKTMTLEISKNISQNPKSKNPNPKIPNTPFHSVYVKTEMVVA